MHSTYKNFALIQNQNIDFVETTCKCCNCGRTLPAFLAYADNLNRVYCRACVEGEHIASIYELAIWQLTRHLDRLDIPYNEPEQLYDGFAVRFPWCEGDVACHSGTYGGTQGLLESYQFAMDDGDVNGYLTALEALEIVLHEWNQHQSRNQSRGE